MKDGIKSSRRSMPPKDYIISGNNVFERTNKRPEDVLNDLLYEDEEEQQVRTSQPRIFTREKLARGIKAVKDYFWGNSCFSIIYCALRDEFDYTPVKSDFEYDMRIIADELHLTYTCPKNTIASTFSYNRDMKLHISKWEGRGMKSRCYNLAKDFIDAIYNDEE